MSVRGPGATNGDNHAGSAMIAGDHCDAVSELSRLLPKRDSRRAVVSRPLNERVRNDGRARSSWAAQLIALNHLCQGSAITSWPCQACPPTPLHLAAAHALR